MNFFCKSKSVMEVSHGVICIYKSVFIMTSVINVIIISKLTISVGFVLM